MADKQYQYLGEPTGQILARLEGNIINMKPGLTSETCCSCACGSCSCNCTCNACGSCYCSCSCCSREDLYSEDVFQRMEELNTKFSEISQILNEIKAGK